MKEIIRKICTVWKPSWDGKVMGRISYTEGKRPSVSYTEKVREGRIISVTLSGDGGEKLSLLLFPLKEAERKEAPAGGTPLCSFSAEEVRAYSTALGDHNGIHQTERPIVSGFQILEALREAYGGKEISVSFHAPLRSGEILYTVKEGNKISGYTDSLCVTAEIGT